MQKIFRNSVVVILALTIFGIFPITPARASQAAPQPPAAAPFSDVPADSWALGAISSAVEHGLMSGMGGGLFGYGRTITRAEFVTALCNMFGWAAANPDSPSFSDVSPGDWFYGYVEAAAAQGVTADAEAPGSGAFAPDTPIFRKDMAVMLVKALGYDVLANQAAQAEAAPFSDVTDDAGYIAVAADIGMISGVGGGRFAPLSAAKREEAAAMLTRVYDRLNAPTAWLQGFYAFSSYGQKDMINGLDAVTFGWSAMKWDAENGAALYTSAAGGNEWRIPDSYELIAEYPRENGVKASLGVYMDAPSGLFGLLADGQARTSAAAQILAEAARSYGAIGRSPYDGVTIDFEGLKGPDAKAQFTAFLAELSEGLKARGLSLCVAVQPYANGQGFDGYDYRAVGQIADKVILMAHDYEPASMDGFVGTEWQKNAALTPIAQVFAVLKAITDPASGVEDRSKIALALSFSCVGWRIDANGKVASPEPVLPSPETVYARMSQADTVKGWSDAYRNPYIIYTAENGKVFLWYEDGRSVAEKLRLARLFGVTGASVWRLGIVPDYPDWDARPALRRGRA
ncbi:MAG: S-layer homology domain-containing protein [Firmicutes bacterium]|nr:S-layer homology domain-containing protein [Bacillota bacterium]